MVEPFLGELRMMAFDFNPRGWAFCNGQLLPINQNQALFSLLGTTYGGNGQTNFALPDLRGRIPVHRGSLFFLGQRSGSEIHTLNVSEMPQHTHTPRFSTDPGVSVNMSNTAIPARAGTNAYAPVQNVVAMSNSAVSSVGASQPHENRQPNLALVFCIALQGIFPSQN